MKYSLISMLTAVLLMMSCGSEHSEPENDSDKKNKITQAQKDSLLILKKEKEADIYPQINYEKIYIADKDQLSEIRKKFAFSKENPYPQKIIKTLNRKEFRYISVGDTIIVPDTIINNQNAYSLFPHYYHGSKDIPKLILVSNEYQAYGCYESGRLVRFAAANTGKERTQTYPGRYSLEWRDRLRRSSLDSNWVLPFTWNFHAQAGNAFHQFDMPGRPVSHSCIRQFMDDAEWLFNWGKGFRTDTSGNRIPLSGTPVIILDHFDFKIKEYGPWLWLKSNKDRYADLPENPMEVEEAYIPLEQIPKEARWGLRNKERYEVALDTLKARGILREGVTIIPSINYNKLRREKKAREMAEKKKKQQADSAKTNMNVILDNLDALESDTNKKKKAEEETFLPEAGTEEDSLNIR
ncbi:MAG: L,D-transpeptidase family protein [Bacteroidota bacterium]